MLYWVLLCVVVPSIYAQVGVVPSVGHRPSYSDPLIEPPYPYDLTYSFQTDDGGSSHMQEVGDQQNTKRGSYGYTGPDGIYRQVDYIADANGFRATIRTNEPGTANQSPAGVELVSENNAAFRYGPAVRARAGPALAAVPEAVPVISPVPVARRLYQPAAPLTVARPALVASAPVAPIGRPDFYAPVGRPDFYAPLAPAARRVYQPLAAAPVPAFKPVAGPVPLIGRPDIPVPAFQPILGSASVRRPVHRRAPFYDPKPYV